jgi:hypothetical protein
VLNLEENLQRTCFSHAFLKTCQYAKINEKVCKGLKHVSIKVAQKDLQKCITWSKKSRKSRQMEQGMCQFMSYLKKSYYSNEDKINFYFC